MTYTEYYRCDLCDTTWGHTWDTEDYDNDYTFCPNCFEFEFEEISPTEFAKIKKVHNDS